jgi:3',5'-cyclic-AMP phosphodiesterase
MNRFFLKTLVIFTLTVFLAACAGKQKSVPDKSSQDGFSFVFMTDIHLQPGHKYPGLPQVPELSPHKAFSMVIDTINKIRPDFVISGGDQVYDVMRGQARADSLFETFRTAIGLLEMPVYLTVGNHDLFGIYEESPTGPEHPEYKYGKYQRYFGKTYYSFDHKGWHFMVLNALDAGNFAYHGAFDSLQMHWLKQDLAGLAPETPIVVALHLPLISVIRQVYPPKDQESGDNGWIRNRNELLDIFRGYNLRLVLQGHIHFVEDIFIMERNLRVISGGSVAGRPTWGGSREGEPPGFLLFNIKGQDISWKFIDYGWKAHVEKFRADYESVATK